ncbi:MAG: hypothetical protein A2583_12435 [Bdellovibrionales bacterium RIFOXYD1_FULL_53_11]|nr:MAG: hypothetical protein A2583_12435 [Bdellovibrionales bacterium RIFOXYD1_FULL_53_11]
MTAPRSLGEALELLDTDGGIRIFAGGTDLMVLLESGTLQHKSFLDIHSIPELRDIRVTPNYITVGAGATFSDIAAHPDLMRELPLLHEAARSVGAIAIQNRATIGGNVANASPAADAPPALLVYDAEIELLSRQNNRRIPYRFFHAGYKKTLLVPNEMIRAFHIPRADRRKCVQLYKKVGTRKAQAISKICFAGLLRREGGRIADARIAFGSVAPVPLRCEKTEQVLKNGGTLAECLAILSSEISPIDDIRSNAAYRLRVAQNIFSRFFQVK